ncbi:unnamed protein product [Rotaria sp. Silwood1]|nr:unnamed protein product [Rotaria sp. Silwood1]
MSKYHSYHSNNLYSQLTIGWVFRCIDSNFRWTDGDIGAVFGLGFPPMKGGTFRFMDTYGISNIVDLMYNYQLDYGDRFAPTQLLIDMVKDNKNFYS